MPREAKPAGTEKSDQLDIPGTELTSSEQSTLDEGQDQLAKIDQGAALPAPEAPPVSPGPADPPSVEGAAAPPEEPPLSQHDKFLAELKDADPETLRQRLVEMHKGDVGQRGALARQTQKIRDRDADLERVTSENARIRAENAALAAGLATAAAREPEPPPPAPKILIKTDEEGRQYIENADLAALLPKPQPVPVPQPAVDPSHLAYQRDIGRIAAQSPEHRATVERIESARVFMRDGIMAAATQYGHRLENAEDTIRIARAYGLDKQLEQHWPGVAPEDLMDVFTGGRLAERVITDIARKWYPQGLSDPNAAPRPQLWPDGAAPAGAADLAPARAVSGGGPAPGGAPRLPLANKPRTLSASGGVRQDPSSSMERFLSTQTDKLLKSHSAELEKLTDEAIKELEAS